MSGLLYGIIGIVVVAVIIVIFFMFCKKKEPERKRKGKKEDIKGDELDDFVNEWK